MTPSVSFGSIQTIVATVSFVGGILGIVTFFMKVAEKYQEPSPSNRSAKILLIVVIGLLCAAVYGVLWRVVQLHFHWNYSAGGHGILPTGWSAISLSICMTLPLAIVPYAFYRLFKIPALSSRHWPAMAWSVCLGAFGYFVLYGTNSNGLRFRIMPPGYFAPEVTALFMEAIYTATYFALIVLPYRLMVAPNASKIDNIVKRTVLPALFTYLLMGSYITFLYPGSVRDLTMVQVRGFISGPNMMIWFCWGMFA